MGTSETPTSSPSAATVPSPPQLVALAVVLATASLLVGLYIWMVNPAASRETRAACTGMRSQAVNPRLGALPVAAPEALFNRYDGKQVKLSDYRGKVVVLNFWEASCKTCKQEKPGLSRMARQSADDELVVLTLAGNESWEDVRALFPKGAPFEVFLDAPAADQVIGPIGAAWGVTGWPETFVIDAKGMIRYHYVSYRDWESSIAQTCLQALIDEA